ncbi:MAG: hypothetical protein AAGF76_15070, partial [Pseudomonadota bacterium]
MSLINDGYGSILQTANPRTGKAVLSWCPVSTRHDKQGTPGALPPDWNRGQKAWAYRDWVKIEAMAWDLADKPPFSWAVACRPVEAWVGEWQNAETTLTLYVAPHVTVQELAVTVDDGFMAPTLKIVRLDSWAEVPMPGSPDTHGGLTGNRPLLEYFHGILQSRFLPPDEPRPPINRSLEDDLAEILPSLYIERSELGIIIEKRTEYRISVTLPAHEPAFFRLSISPPRNFVHQSPLPFTTPYTAVAYDFELICSPNVTVDFEMEYMRVRIGHLPVSARLRVFTVPQEVSREPRIAGYAPDGKPSGDTEIVTVADNYADLNLIRPKGEGLDVYPSTNPLDPLALLESLIVGFIPVVNLLYDFGDILSIAMTGRDQAGRKGSYIDIGLIAVFGLLGIVGDVARAADMSFLKRLAGLLLPGAWRVADDTGFARAMRRGAFAGSPALLEAGQILARLDAGDPELIKRFPQLVQDGAPDALARLRRIEQFAQAGDRAAMEAEFKALQDALEVILKDQAERIPFDQQPATLNMMRRFEGGLRRAVTWAAGDEATAEKAMALFNEAYQSNTLDGLVAALGKIEVPGKDAGHLEKVMRETLIEFVRLEVVNNPSVIRRATAYNNLKRVTTPLSVLDYIKQIAGKGTEGQIAVEYAYGREAWNLIRDVTPRPSAREVLDRVADVPLEGDAIMQIRYIDQVAEWMNNLSFYDIHREMIGESFPGLGLILNSDHLLERRFRKLIPDQEPDT